MSSAITVNDDGTFRFYMPSLYAFEKANAPEGQKRRIGGLVSTETRDRENEVILQRGLDFSEFLKSGYFNDNHAKDVAGIVGTPDPKALRYVKKGEVLPNGETAPANGHWAEGWMLEGDRRAEDIWSKIQSLQKSPNRRLGFSIEGAIQRRTGRDFKTIAKAKVRHVAITHCPVNMDTRLDVLAKSLGGDEAESPAMQIAEAGVYLGEEAYNNRDLGTVQAQAALGPGASEAAEAVPMDGTRPDVQPLSHSPSSDSVSLEIRGALSQKALTTSSGAALIPESLEHDVRVTRKALTHGEALDLIKSRFPNVSYATAGKLLDTLLLIHRRAA